MKPSSFWEGMVGLGVLITPILFVMPLLILGLLLNTQPVYYIVYSIYIIGSLIIIKHSEREWSEFGLTGTNLSDSLTLSIGFVSAFIIIQAIQSELHLSTELGPLAVIQQLIYCFAFSGLAQELLFRGVLFFSIMRWRGWRTALVVTSILFGIVHVLKGISYIIATVIIGFFYGYVVYRTRNIIGPTIAHGLNNFILGFVLVV